MSIRLRRKGAATLSAIFMLSAFFMVVAASGTVSAYTPHANISIVNDSDCAIGQNGIVSGTGTSADPYVISGWEVSSIGIGSLPSTLSYSITISDVKCDNINFICHHGTILDSVIGNAHFQRCDGTVRGCTVNGSVSCALVYGGDMVVEDCTFVSVGATAGVSFAQVNAHVTNCTFAGYGYGIAGGQGTDLSVSGCALSDNDIGLELIDVLGGAIDSCSVHDNNIGIRFEEYSQEIVFSENDIFDNGVGVAFLGTNTHDCLFYHNNFDNTVQTQGGDNCVWNDSYPSGGNYWSDHVTTDVMRGPLQNIPGSDGIVDVAYHLSGSTAVDYYPLASPYVPLIVVGIDIRPGAAVNNINLKSNGQLPVAILGSADFNVAWVNVSSLRIGTVAPVSNPHGVVYHVSDVNGDGFADLTVNFRIPSLVSGGALTSSTTSLEVTGSLNQAHSSIPISGTDAVKVK